MNSLRMKLKRRTPSPPPHSQDEQHQIPDDDDDHHHSHRYQEIKKQSLGHNTTSSSSSSAAYPTTLIVRNISHDTSQEALRIPFEKFGPINDVYIPRDYYTGKPRSFGFVKYRNTDDATEAKYHMNNQIIGGRQISIVFAKEDSKSPEEMNAKAQIAFEGRSPPRSARRLHHSHRHSISPAEGSTSRGQSRATRSPYSEDKAESTREEREDTSE